MTQQGFGYTSIYKGHEVHPHGGFKNFVKDVHQHAKHYGYWQFGGQGNIQHNEAIAFSLGFHAPEQLLSAYNHGTRNHWHEEIILTWIAGNTDPYQVTRVGTAGQHMATIAEERKVLGFPPLLAHEIPFYPISFEPALHAHRQGRYHDRSLVSPHPPIPKTLSGSFQSESHKAHPMSNVWEGPQGPRPGNVPSASALQNLPPPPPTYHSMGPFGTAPMAPAQTTPVPSLHQQNHAREGYNVIFSSTQAHNPSLIAQSRARTAALIAIAHEETAAACAAAQRDLVNIPLSTWAPAWKQGRWNHTVRSNLHPRWKKYSIFISIIHPNKFTHHGIGPSFLPRYTAPTTY
ncbi:hypothetical protein P171DRAFT_483628 [Karstenula rhodostoma CBS 690.94]|uniref:Uncharacterized protein n=1 Tax=Karstenula rhodostoma CBS 690.94 TaxID=1392251 RepID=A0A9P4UDL1_9PLEO|nr:hypothetical protein P171DRAFT_483628 [Karstenula rhodostoma CBS 690.94]